jgi:hypothetical protein
MPVDRKHSWCKPCLAAYDRERWLSSEEKERKNKNRQRRKIRQQEVINKIKLDSGCVDCGYNEHVVALDFDHVGSDKRFNISDAWSMGVRDETLLDEIAKCVVRCSNCHRVITHQRRQIAE